MEALITNKELYQLRQDLRNKTKLHDAARARVKRLEEIIRAQKREIIELKAARESDHALILELKRQLEELRAKIFKRRKHHENTPDETEQPHDTDDRATTPKKHATRPIPQEETITSRHEHQLSISCCERCGTALTAHQTVEYYTEDIMLPSDQPLKTVEQITIERGWCRRCRRWRYAHPPPAAAVTLGQNVRAYVSYLSILLRLSYEQIRMHLRITYRMELSDGEISHILEKEAVALRPEYEALSGRIDTQGGIHEDETGWPVQALARGNYAWVKTGTETKEAVFLFGESRGGGVAEKLTGIPLGVGITDDYAAYHGIFKEKHQLCWAHPHRKLRDVARSEVFTGETHEHCQATYRQFSVIYTALRDTLSLPWDAERNRRVRTRLMRRLRTFGEPHMADPFALMKIKTRLLAVIEKYFTCLLYPCIPADNNKAERALRHMVIKRKTAFGSKTQKGAAVLSVLASVILSLYWTKPHTFWQEYMRIRAV